MEVYQAAIPVAVPLILGGLELAGGIIGAVGNKKKREQQQARIDQGLAQMNQLTNQRRYQYNNYLRNTMNLLGFNVPAPTFSDNIFGRALQKEYDKNTFVSGDSPLFSSKTQSPLDYLSGLSAISDQSRASLGNIANQLSSQTDLYNRGISSQANSLLDKYLQTSGQIEGLGQQAFDTSSQAYGSMLDTYKTLANSNMPGMDIYRGQIGAQTSSDIQRLKDMGANSSLAVSSLLSNKNDQLRNLALEAGNYKLNQKQNLAQAFSVYGQQMQGAYNNQISNIGQAAQLEGAGRQSVIGANQSMFNNTLNTSEALYNIEQGRYNIGANNVQQAANLNQMQYDREKQGYIYNQLMPYQNQLNFMTGLTSSYDPFQAQMGVLGESVGMDYANLMGLYNQQAANNQGAANAAGSLTNMLFQYLMNS